jgi:hypothetical protein
MKTKGIIVLILTASLFLNISIAAAMHGEGQHGPPWEGWQGSGEWGMDSRYQRTYDPASLESISGVVEAVERIAPMEGMSYGIHILIKTDGEIMPVHLGPMWYIERLDIRIKKGDQVEVKGARAKMAGKPTIIASEVKKGDTIIILRDENGVPVWSGWKRGRR